MSISAFGVDHGDQVSKAEEDHRKRNVAVGAGATGAGTAAVLGGTKIPEHSHYDKKTRKYLHSLPAGEHDIPTKMLGKKNPRKLGARKQQRSYVAAMAQERPLHTYGPVPITRYKGKGHQTIQRDNAHSVMAHSMKGRKTVRVKIEDAPGYRPNRRTGEELVRRGQAKYQQRRLKQHTNISDKKIKRLVSEYKPESRKANTAKRPHGVVEETLSYSKKPYNLKRAIRAGKNVSLLAKRDDRRGQDVAAGVTGAAGVGTLAATPVRRSAAKVNVSGGSMSAKDAKKIVSPGYRPGNRKAIKTMAASGGLDDMGPTRVIRYKGGHVLPFDGNHRATARVARGDKKVPVHLIEGGERPAVSVTRNLYHGAQQKLHQSRMNRNVFKPDLKPSSKTYTGRHKGESKAYGKIANASPSRSGKRVNIGSTKTGSGPTKAMLRTRQGATLAAGGALLGTAGYLHREKR
jgi:hypothetical protein